MLIILALVLAVLAAAAVSVYLDKRKLSRSAKALGLDEPGVRVVDCDGPMFRFAVKRDEGNAYAISDVNAGAVRIPLADITGCEFSDGGERGEGVGRAVSRFIVGGAVTDAMDGALRGTFLRIYTKDPDRPVAAEYRLRRSTYLQDFRRFAREVSRLVEEIAADNEEE